MPACRIRSPLGDSRTLRVARPAGWLLALVLGIVAAGAQTLPPAAGPEGRTAIATFAGGCFWCVEEAFEKVTGVLSAVSGYTGGTTPNPTYEQVTYGDTGHFEAVQVTYDPARVSYEKLTDWFWRNIDPTQADGQFCDHGSSYRTAIFVHDNAQRQVAEATKEALEASGRFDKPIATKILAAGRFYQAEDYHQGYYEKNPLRYRFYKYACGRPQRLGQLWGKPGPPP